MDQQVTAPTSSLTTPPSERPRDGEQPPGRAWRRPTVTRLSMDKTMFSHGTIIDGHTGSTGG